MNDRLKSNLIILAGIVLIVVCSFRLGRSIYKPCKFGICDDPRACRIHWDDGSVQFKSRIVEIGTLEPGQKAEVRTLATMGEWVSVHDPNDWVLVDSNSQRQSWLRVDK